MADGFKIGEGFIEIDPSINLAEFRAAAKAAGLVVGDEMVRGADRDRHVFAQRFLSGLLTPDAAVLSALRTGVPRVLSSPLGLAGVTLGIAFAASFVGAAVAVLASAGTAGAFAIIGTLALKENARVQAAFQETGNVLKSIFADAAEPMIAPIVSSLGVVRKEAAKLGPDLRSIFETVAGVIPPITQDLTDFVSILTKAAERNMPAFSGILQHVADQLPGLAEHLGGFFDTLGANEGTINRAVDLFFDMANALVDEAGPAVVELTELWNQMGPTIDLLVSGVDAFVQLLNLFGAVLAVVNPLIQAFADDLKEAGDTLEFVAGPLIWVADQLGIYSSATEEASGQTITYAKTLVGATTQIEEMVSAAQRAAPVGEQMADAITTLNDSAANATDKIKALNSVIDALIGKNISLEEAKIRTAQAVDDLSAAIEGESDKVKDNSHSLNINTQRGRDNYNAIIKVADGITDQINAYAELHGQGPELEAFASKTIDSFRRTMRQAGFTKEQIDDVTSAIGLIPSAKNTIVTLSDNASQRAAAIRGALALIPRVINIVANVTGKNLFAEGGLVPDMNTGRYVGQFPQGGRVPLGLGGPKQDNLIAAVSSGEFWVNAVSTAKHLALLEAINSDRVQYARPEQGQASPMGQLADAATRSQKPVTINVYDVDNVLIGTMQGVAEETEHRIGWEHAVGRR